MLAAVSKSFFFVFCCCWSHLFYRLGGRLSDRPWAFPVVRRCSSLRYMFTAALKFGLSIYLFVAFFFFCVCFLIFSGNARRGHRNRTRTFFIITILIFFLFSFKCHVLRCAAKSFFLKVLSLSCVSTYIFICLSISIYI